MTDPAANTENTLPTDSYEVRLCEALANKREARLTANITNWKPRTNNASAISSCSLQMYFARMRSEDRAKWNTWTQGTVEDGKHEERLILQELMEDGWELEAAQAQVDIKDARGRVVLTGKIDTKIRWEGHKVPLEIKRVQPYIFKQASEKGTAILLLRSWTRKYLWQIQTYLYQHNEPRGILVLSDGLGHRLFLVVTLDLSEMETILKTCEAVEDAVEAKTPPPPLPLFDPDICGRCNWQHICPVERGGAGAEIITDGEIVELLEERDRSKDGRDAYEAADKRVKDLLKERERVLVAGKWLVTGQWKERSVSAKPASVSRYWQSKIERMDGGAE